MKSFRGAGLVAIAGAISVSHANAAEYSVTPFATAKAEYDTNRRLASVNEESTFGQILDIGALFRYQSDETALSFTPKFSLQRHGDDGSGIDQDRENYYLNANGQHRFNERWSAGMSFDYANTGVVAAELEDLGLVEVGSGTISTFDPINESFTRESISFGPSVTYILSERNSLRFGAGFNDTTYDNQNTLLSDYSSFSVNGSWIHQLSETNQIVTSVFGLIQDPELNNQVLGSAGSTATAGGVHDVPDPETLQNKFEQFGATIAYIHSFNPTLTGTLSVGARHTSGDFPDLIDFDFLLSEESQQFLADNGFGTVSVVNRLDPNLDGFLLINPQFLNGASVANRVYDQGSVSNSGILFDASLEKQYERTTYTARFSRASIPSGTGLTERDEYAIHAVHDFSDRLQGTGSFRFFSNENESELTLSQGLAQSTDQIRLEAGVNYRLTEFWTLGGGYQYRQRSPENGDTADGHLVFVSIGYNGRRYSMSR